MKHLMALANLRPVVRALAAFGTLAPVAAFALSPSNVPLERQVDEAFRQVIEAPGDMTSGMRYAQLLVQAGNYEGGIAALERLLLTPDAPPTVRLELAVLYFRLGSYSMSETLLRAALDDARLAAEQRTLAEQLLRDAVKRNQVSRLDGLITIGVRTQTNPSARSHRSSVLSEGNDVLLDSAYKPKSDTDLQLGLRLDHRYDLGAQNEASIVSSLAIQTIHYRSSSGSELEPNQTAPYNFALAEITSGIRFKPTQNVPGLFVRPHLIAAILSAQGHEYLRNAGAGLDLEYNLNGRTRFDAGYEYRDFRYANRVDVPDAKLLGGPDQLVRVRLTHELAPGRLISGEWRSRFHRTDRAYYDYDSHEARVAYSASYASPLAALDGYWTTTVWGGVQRRSYDGADPAIDPHRTRRDDEWRVGISTTVPLSPSWSVSVQLEHLRSDANLPNYDNKNTALSGVLAYRF